MFRQLQTKWKVSGKQLLLILCVFAITGTTTAYITRQITRWLALDASSAWYWILKLSVLLFGYQVLILLIAIPFGQFRFFWNYEKKILRRMGIIKETGDNSKVQAFDSAGMPATQVPSQIINNQQTLVAIFASGAGSNAQRIIDYFRQHPAIKIALVVCNKPGAGVLTIAQQEGIATLLIEKEPFFRGDAYVPQLKAAGIGFIVLAGFLWKVPSALIAAFPNKIVNIHPALLPAYGGKGMYGMFVHEAVIAAAEKQSGITIHFVDELYDHGQIIHQATCSIEPGDTAATLVKKIHALEHTHYPQVIEAVILNSAKN